MQLCDTNIAPAHSRRSRADVNSFGMNDRSGKVRWLAHELGLPVKNHKVEMGEHRKFPYRIFSGRPHDSGGYFTGVLSAAGIGL